MIALWLIVGALASWRLAYLFTIDTGPARIFERIRGIVRSRFGPDSWQFEGATCAFCQSVWYAGVMAVLLFWDLPVRQIAALWLAMAGLAALIHWWVLAKMRQVG